MNETRQDVAKKKKKKEEEVAKMSESGHLFQSDWDGLNLDCLDSHRGFY